MATLLDDFNSGLGKWSTWRAGAPLAITSGALTNDGVNFRCGSYYNVAQLGPAVETTVTVPTFAADGFELNLRTSTTDAATATCYKFTVANSAAGGSAISYYSGGAFVANVVIDLAFNSWVAGDTVKCVANGSALALYRNGGVVLSGTDVNIAAAGWLAIEITQTAKTTSLDNLFGDTLAAAAAFLPQGPRIRFS